MNAPMTLPVERDRKRFLGGSDIAAVIGVSPWKDQLRLYAEKRGEIEPDERETKAMRRGRILEPSIIQLYREEYGVDVAPGVTLQMPGAPHFRAQVDAIENVDGKGIPVEAKSASEYTRGKWGPTGTDDAPTYYCAQLHWQLQATGAAFGRIVALLGADDLRVYTIERDDKVCKYLLEQAHEFWQRVVDGKPPELDYNHPTAGETLTKLFRNFVPTEILQADDTLRAWRDIMVESTDLEARYSATKDAAKAHLLMAMRNAGVIDFGDGQMFERKTVKRKGYTVEATEYVSGRIIKTKAVAGAPALAERIEHE